jgi:hypothetical protein
MRPDAVSDPELKPLIDESNLRALAATYMRGLDRLDPLIVRSVFADNATTHYGAFTGGPDEMAAMAMNSLGAYRTTQHFLGQINLSIDGDAATGEVYFQAFHQHGTENFDRFICGRYVDRYARLNGTWLITHRTEVVDWTRTEPTAENYFTSRPHTVRGTRDKSDLSYRPHEA